MGAVTTIPVEDWFTADDLDSLPDDGQRYELLDDELLVSPAPRPLHQHAVMQLAFALELAVPVGMRVFPAPLDVRLSQKRQLQPDVLVVLDGPLDVTRIETTPLLVVEVLSPSTRARDLITKRAAYLDAGIPSYWVVDTAVPSLTVFSFVDGAYREQVFSGEEVYDATSPFPVRIVPATLIR